MSRLRNPYPVVDLFAGPGGLGEGFASLTDGRGKRRFDSVVAIERDDRAIAALEEVQLAYPGRLTLLAGDALAASYSGIAAGQPAKIVANLPYNIATQLLTGWLTVEPWPPWFASLTLMFQKEVAERIVAPPGGKEYGRLSVLAQYRCTARKLFDVNRSAFTPPPKVTSSIVQLIPRATPAPDCDLKLLERVTAAAFGQRRKMLRSSLRTLVPDPEIFLAAAGIDPQLRAEQVPVEGFARMAALLRDGLGRSTEP